MTIFELKLKIKVVKKQLADTDYKALKFAEGLISEEDYATIKAERENYREEIRMLEAELEALKKES